MEKDDSNIDFSSDGMARFDCHGNIIQRNLAKLYETALEIVKKRRQEKITEIIKNHIASKKG